jgi:TolB-like protein/DNA-binding winged helix-turn-helix (wHTH) protein/Tfp pilus assembly protein PilF
VPLSARAFDTLQYLVEHPNQLIDKRTLMAAVWPDLVVEDNNLNQTIAVVRRALEETAGEHRFVITVPGRGFQFVPAVTRREANMRLDGSLNDHRVRDALPTPRGESPVASPVTGGEAPSAARHTPWSRPAIVVAFAAVLVLIAGAAAYYYLLRAGQRTAGVSPAVHSLAVLPLENLSGDKEQEYFADGMTDELITELGKIGALRVVSRTSTMQYKGTRKPLSDIAGKLKVDAVLEGTILRSGNRVRITAQLIEATSDRHLWAQSYERDLKDVLVLQDDVSRDIAEAIRIKLTPKQRTLLTAARAVDPEAHDAYLKGRYWGSTSWSSFSRTERVWKGLDYFQKAIAKDPSYALAYAGVADSFQMLGSLGGLPIKEAFPKAKEAAMKALQLEPSLAEAHASLAGVKLSYDWDWAGAEREFKEALALNPNYATAHHWYSDYLDAMGRFDEAVRELERARDLDPYSILITDSLGIELYHARRYDDALRQFRRGFEMYPDIGLWSWHMAYVYEQKKMFAEAYAQYHQSISLNKETQRAAALEQAYKRSGYRAAVWQMIHFVEQGPKSNVVFINPIQAHLYAMLDDEAHAMLSLERAYDERNPYLLRVMLRDPALDHLRGSPRFRDLVRRIGLPPLVDRVPVGNLPDHEPLRAR